MCFDYWSSSGAAFVIDFLDEVHSFPADRPPIQLPLYAVTRFPRRVAESWNRLSERFENSFSQSNSIETGEFDGRFILKISLGAFDACADDGKARGEIFDDLGDEG